MDKLSAKQKAFVDCYLLDPNATKAAMAAGYKKETARVMGYNLLNNPKVKKIISAKQATKSEQLDIKRDDILKGLLAIFTEGGMDKDRIAAADKICKMQGFYATEKIEHSGAISCVAYMPNNGRLTT